jgi:hypothetical protein
MLLRVSASSKPSIGYKTPRWRMCKCKEITLLPVDYPLMATMVEEAVGWEALPCGLK